MKQGPLQYCDQGAQAWALFTPTLYSHLIQGGNKKGHLSVYQEADRKGPAVPRMSGVAMMPVRSLLPSFSITVPRILGNNNLWGRSIQAYSSDGELDLLIWAC